LLLIACVLDPILLPATMVGFVLVIPTFVREMPWHYLLSRPHRFIGAMLVIILKTFRDWLITVGFAGVFFGASVAGDRHPRAWQLPYRIRVAFRLMFTAKRYFGMERFTAWEKRILDRALAYCEAHPPTHEQIHMPVPRVRAADITPREFYKHYVASSHPVVLEGFNADSHAVRHWKPEYFRKYADDVAPVYDLAAKDKDAYALVRKCTLAEYLDYIRDNEDLPPAERAPMQYLANFANLSNSHPELIDELEVKKMSQYLCGAKVKGLAGVHIFMGLSGTATPFHCANTMNWFFQVQGQKRWTFVHPEHMAMMYPVATADAFYVGSVMEYPETPKVVATDFPLWEYCPRYDTVLNPGDVLFNPSWWWHRIYNESSPTIGCASRWVHLPPMKTNTLFEFFLAFNAHFLSNLTRLICKSSGEHRLTDETTLTVKQRRSRAELAMRLNARRPSRQKPREEELSPRTPAGVAS
jgi:hypothetical protein